MKFYNESLKYRDRFGMNQLTTKNGVGEVTQNGALFTMEYLIALLEDPTIPDNVKDLEVARLRYVYGSLEVLPGLTRRTPESTEGDSMDNTGASSAFCGMFGKKNRDGSPSQVTWDFARRAALHGRDVECIGIDMVQDPTRNTKFYNIARLVTATQLLWRPWTWLSWAKTGFKPRYFWNNTRPTEFCLWGWHGRSPGHLGEYDIASGGWTTPFRFISVLVGQFLGCFKEVGDTDARKLPYVQWYFLTKGTGLGQRWFWKLMYRLWVYILLKQYPNGMRDVYARYYGDPNHPLRWGSKRYFGEKV